MVKSVIGIIGLTTHLMSNKLLAVILILLLAAGGFTLYSKYRESVIREGGAAITAVSFICDNGLHFVAEFDAEFANLNVIESGDLTRSLPAALGEGVIFANANWEYAFGGEEVRVTDLVSGTGTTCRQPFDPNNAPYNFGDLPADDGSIRPDTALVASESIVGTWRSLDDSRFAREFRGDGRFIDSYEGTSDSIGVWRVFTGEDLPGPVGFEPEPEIAYLLLTDDITPEVVMHFRIARLTPEELEIIYMEGGGVLRFTHVEQ